METYWMDHRVEDVGKTIRGRLELAQKKEKEAREDGEEGRRHIWYGAKMVLEDLIPKLEALELEWEAVKSDERDV